jgi:hypothetical protein
VNTEGGGGGGGFLQFKGLNLFKEEFVAKLFSCQTLTGSNLVCNNMYSFN